MSFNVIHILAITLKIINKGSLFKLSFVCQLLTNLIWLCTLGTPLNCLVPFRGEGIAFIPLTVLALSTCFYLDQPFVCLSIYLSVHLSICNWLTLFLISKQLGFHSMSISQSFTKNSVRPCTYTFFPSCSK